MSSPLRTNSPRRNWTTRLEFLERRSVLSANPAAIDTVGHTLTISGDDSANTITISDDGNGDITASETTANGTLSATATGISRILVDTRGGNDVINYTLTGNLTNAEKLAFDLGKGADQPNLDFSPGISANLGVTVNGGAGSDAVAGRRCSAAND